MFIPRPRGLWFGCWLLLVTSAQASSIDTSALEQPWPKQWTHEYEVGKYPVTWRQAASAKAGIFAGARFVAPSAPDRTWALATDYTDLGRMTPGVQSVTIAEETPTRRLIQIDMKVLWKTVRLTFEIEHEPPRAVRFRLVNRFVGEYRGVCLMEPAEQGTAVELATWLKPAAAVPKGLVLSVERMLMLKGIREFVQTCEQAPTT